MSAALLGDAASVSALVASLRRRAGDLEIRADEADGAHVAAGPGWVGRVAVGHRRRVDTVTAASRGAAARMRELADALDDFAAALGEAQHDLRRASDEARSHGLVVQDGQVLPGWGISGEADGSADAERAETAERLGRRLQRSAVLLERRRAALAHRAEEVSRWLP
ncbi:hypothetical protein M3697_03580 [Janibacter melonis]|uniref:hypothetical protein n=1 Tax=Janibacter melonis TaxID=262209 RepID=UPI0020436383|nr:hypothetical protein [Janibacter melonis]MCM3554189.1 hypothetical protein [Janibacter melonis]